VLTAASDVTSTSTQIYKVLLSLFTSAGSIWALCNKVPVVIGKQANFPEVRQLSIVLTVVFIALIVGGFGPPQEQLLEGIAILATTIGTSLFFIVLQHSRKYKPATIPIWMMLMFFLYTCAISCGVTSASVYVLLKSTDQAAISIRGQVPDQGKVK
jgi:hypothetical protein